MIRRPPIYTPRYSSAASDVYKRQVLNLSLPKNLHCWCKRFQNMSRRRVTWARNEHFLIHGFFLSIHQQQGCERDVLWRLGGRQKTLRREHHTMSYGKERVNAQPTSQYTKRAKWRRLSFVIGVTETRRCKIRNGREFLLLSDMLQVLVVQLTLQIYLKKRFGWRTMRKCPFPNPRS